MQCKSGRQNAFRFVVIFPPEFGRGGGRRTAMRPPPLRPDGLGVGAQAAEAGAGHGLTAMPGCKAPHPAAFWPRNLDSIRSIWYTADKASNSKSSPASWAGKGGKNDLCRL